MASIVTNFSFKGFIETFIIPAGGIYCLSAWGASGGGVNKPRGAFSQSFVFLEKNEIIHILVGESGDSGDPNSDTFIRCGGGGGGTFIAKGNNISTSVPLCVAGGGGSQNNLDTVHNYAHGQSTLIGGDSGNRLQIEGNGGLSYYGSGGGGFYSDGLLGSDQFTIRGSPGIAFINGGSHVQGTQIPNAYGGFGGGAANHGYCGHNQGGGGYTGGSSYGDYYTHNGGGGGSFFISHDYFLGQSVAGFEKMPSPSGIVFITGNLGHGFARITLLPKQYLLFTSIKCGPVMYIKYSLLLFTINILLS